MSPDISPPLVSSSIRVAAGLGLVSCLGGGTSSERGARGSVLFQVFGVSSMKALEEQKGLVAERFRQEHVARKGPSSHQLPHWSPGTWTWWGRLSEGTKPAEGHSRGNRTPPPAFQAELPAAAGGHVGLGDAGTWGAACPPVGGGQGAACPPVGRTGCCVSSRGADGVPRVLPWERGDLRAGDTLGRPAEGQAAERHGGPRLCRGERPTPSAWPQHCREQRDPSGPRWWGCHSHFRAGQGLTEECAERRAACRRPEVPSPGTPTLCRP